MKKWIKPIFILLLMVIFVNLFATDLLPTFQKDEDVKIVLIDPGHGGDDPGKVGIHGELEKDINLAIGLMLVEKLEEEGIEVLTTRDTDKGLYSDSAKNKKREDLMERARIANESMADLVISIHQNSYTQEKCRGAQVFYYEGSVAGEQLAGYIQDALITNADPENKRLIKANKDYYLLKNSDAPAVIVECGFLSNSEEAEKLTQEDYQRKIAEGITQGVLLFFDADVKKEEVL